ncbi:MAG: HPr family phosphocarrier protein [Thermodesulfobacteriota bacterium]|nr:MAG: HPr family phosphocarrier protein [Thermodesulfobacteriota bacterium]
MDDISGNMAEFVEKTFLIKNKLGLHARAASMFVQVASGFESDIFIVKNDHEVNGKSIMGILILAAPKGVEITVRAKGSDAEDAVTALGKLIEDRFGEEQ